MASNRLGKWVLGAVAVAALGQAAGRLVPRETSLPVDDNRAISRSLASSVEIEPHLAATLEGDVAVAWMALPGGKDDRGASKLGARVSHDRGQTWGDVLVLASPDGKQAADPTVAFFRRAPRVTWLGFRAGAGEGSDHSVYTASIGEAPTRLNAADPAGAVYDRPWSASTGERLYVVYERESAGKKSVVLSSSDDGEHFSSDVVAEGGVLPTVCASGNNVAVAWVDPSSGVMVAASQDGGKKFGRYIASTAREHVALEVPSCVLSGSDLFVAYGATDQAPVTPAGSSPTMDYVVVIRSRDAGRSTADRANVRPGSRLMHPALSLRGSGGLDLAVLAGNADDDPRGRLLVVRVSATGAARPPRPLREPLFFSTAHAAAGWSGDYFGFASTDQVSFVAVVDTKQEVSDAGIGMERHVVLVPVSEE